jgi:glycosyltransferase involved in cell wall biosynthesis
VSTGTPSVSVILPAWNSERTIRRAVDSILRQSVRELELVVVDDGSTDGTVAVATAGGDARVRVLSGDHAGVAAAMNRGVAAARAPLIARMDADDFAHPRRIERQLDHLHSQRLDVVGGLVRIIDAEGRPVPSLERYETWVNGCRDHESIAAHRFVESPLVNPTVLARRAVFEPGCRAGDFPEDYDLWLRVIAAGFRCGKVNEVVLDWTDGPDRLTRSSDRYSFAAFDRCRREHLLNGPLREAATVNLWGAGQTGKPWLRWLHSADKHVGFVVDVAPNKIGKRIHGVPVIDAGDLPQAGGAPLLIAVGATGARELIAPVLTANGYVSGKDAWFVA